MGCLCSKPAQSDHSRDVRSKYLAAFTNESYQPDDAGSQPQPRLCHLQTVPDFQGFGFNLHTDTNTLHTVITSVDAGSPAEAGGLRKGDRVTEVDGFDVEREGHAAVCVRVKDAGERVSLLVVDVAAETEAAAQKKKKSGEFLENGGSGEGGQNGGVPNGVTRVDESFSFLEESSGHQPRLSYLCTWPDFDGYGFTLGAEKGLRGGCISGVDADSPAEVGGLKKNDRIIEINGENVENLAHSAVIQKIRLGGDRMSLLLVDQETGLKFKKRGEKVSSSLNNVVVVTVPPRAAPVADRSSKRVSFGQTYDDVVPRLSAVDEEESSGLRPRLCHLRQWSHFDGFGFNLQAKKNQPNVFLGSVDPGSPAQMGGLLGQDRIIEVNGENVETLLHAEVVARIQAGGPRVSLLVVDAETDADYRDRGERVSGSSHNVLVCTAPSSMDGDPTTDSSSFIYTQSDGESPQEESSQLRPRLCHLRQWRDFDGYGFNLQQQAQIDGAPNTFISSVDPDSPAQLGGLRKNDRVVEINGENVETLPHFEVVHTIKTGGESVSLLVVDAETDADYRDRGELVSGFTYNILVCTAPSSREGEAAVPSPDSSVTSEVPPSGSDVIEGPEEEGGLPPLRPPRRSKQQLISSPDVFRRIDRIVRTAPAFVANTTEELAQYLISKCSSDLEIVRAFYCWLANNISYDTTSYFSGHARPQDARSVLQSGLAVCGGYADLFSDLCRVAEIPCLNVTGIAKGFSHDPEAVYSDGSATNHAWNLVVVAGEWRPLDCTWGAGYVDVNTSFQRKFEEHWFLTDPLEFMPRHFPLVDGDPARSERLQLLRPPVSVEYFSALVKMESAAFSMGLRCLSHDTSVIEVHHDAHVRVKATRRPLRKVSASLTERGLQAEGNQRAGVLLSLSAAGTCTVYVRPPRAATFLLKVFGSTNEDDANLDQLLCYVIRCTEVHPNPQPLPDKHGFWGLRTRAAAECGLSLPRPLAEDEGGEGGDNEEEEDAGEDPPSFTFTATQGHVSVPVALTTHAQLLVHVTPARDGDADLGEFAFIEYTEEGAAAVIHARLPEPGYYKLAVFAGTPDQTSLNHVADFLLYAEEACADREPYPGKSMVVGLKLPKALQCGLKQSEDSSFIFTAKNGAVTIPLSLSRFALLGTTLKHARNLDNKLDELTLVENTEDGAVVSCRLPEPGYYLLRVHASHPEETGLVHVADMLLKADEGHEDCRPFPRAYRLAYTQRVKLLAPRQGAVPAGEATLYRLQAPGLARVRVGGVAMEMKNDGVWEAEVTPEKGKEDVTAYGAVDKDAATLEGLYAFTVR